MDLIAKSNLPCADICVGCLSPGGFSNIDLQHHEYQNRGKIRSNLICSKKPRLVGRELHFSLIEE